VSGSSTEDLRGPWLKGVNNRASNSRLPQDALRNAVNVELLADGSVRRRDGYSLVTAGAYHSLWSENDVALVVKANALTSINYQTLAETTLLSGLSAGRPMVYHYGPDSTVYYTNGVITGRVASGAIRPWGIEHASAQPTLTALTSGGLDAGRYQVAITYVAADGEEGGSTTAASIEVTIGGGIQAAAIPQPASSYITHIRVYVSEANGTVLYHYGDIADGTTSVTINASSTLGRQLDAQFLYPMPAGTAIEEFNGRMYVAVANQLWFSEPSYFGQRRMTNYFLFPDTITLVSRAGTSGIHVGADKLYFLDGGDPTDFNLRVLSTARSVRGTLVKKPDSNTRMWFTDRGVVESPGNGSIEERLTEQLVIDEATEGAAMYRERDGENFMIGVLKDGTQSTAVAGDFMDAEVIRRS
jgi:hypothetical protein